MMGCVDNISIGNEQRRKYEKKTEASQMVWENL